MTHSLLLIIEEYLELHLTLNLRMMKRAEAAKCFISGLMDFRNASNGVTLAHCLATYGQVLALETVIENDPNIVNLVDDSGSGFKDYHCSPKLGRMSVYI